MPFNQKTSDLIVKTSEACRKLKRKDITDPRPGPQEFEIACEIQKRLTEEAAAAKQPVGLFDG